MDYLMKRSWPGAVVKRTTSTRTSRPAEVLSVTADTKPVHRHRPGLGYRLSLT